MDIQPIDLKAGLYLVATPIGNLRDITLRALDVLSVVDVIYCEDTRVSGKLLAHYGIKKPLVSYNDHNADARRDDIIRRIHDGDAVALISDAGMPLISDPGYKLVRDCAAHDIYITSLPGANAPLMALQLSALPSDNFCFIGFLPTKARARKTMLQNWQSVQAPLIIFESARRLSKTLSDIHEIYGDRNVVVAREMTKMFEEIRRDHVSALMTHYNEHGAPKGEVVVVIDGADDTTASTEDIARLLTHALKTMRTKDAAAYVAQQTGAARKIVYEMALTVGRGDNA